MSCVSKAIKKVNKKGLKRNHFLTIPIVKNKILCNISKTSVSVSYTKKQMKA